MYIPANPRYGNPAGVQRSVGSPWLSAAVGYAHTVQGMSHYDQPRFTVRRMPLALALTAAVTLLAGCSTVDTSKERTCKATSAMSPLTAPGAGTYYTEEGVVSIREGNLVVLRKDCSTGILVAGGVEHVFGIWNTVEGVLVVYRTVPVDGEAELLAVPLDESSLPVRIGYAAAPEFNVTAVSYDRAGDRWEITAISDLTETIDLVDRGNPAVHTVLDPFPYNDFSTLLVTVADQNDGFITVVSPYTAVDSGVESAWFAYQMDAKGNEVGRLELLEVNSTPEASRKLVPLEEGAIQIVTDACTFILRSGAEGVPDIDRIC